MLRDVRADGKDHRNAQGTLQTVLSAIWLRSRTANEHRLAVLEAGCRDITDGAFNHASALDAAREAHKLAGGLGSFGFSQASDAARTLEQFWRAYADQRPNDLSPDDLAHLLAQVRLALEQPLPARFDASALAIPSDTVRDDNSASANQCDVRVGVVGAVDNVDIVLVEDDASVAELLARALNDYGLSVRRFEAGEEALAALVGPRPAVRARVIVLDYDLPGCDGLAVLRQLRDGGVLTSTRVLMLSLTVGREAVARAINAGASGYIAKPFHWKTVIERVQMCLEGEPPLFVIGPSTRRNAVLVDRSGR